MEIVVEKVIKHCHNFFHNNLHMYLRGARHKIDPLLLVNKNTFFRSLEVESLLTLYTWAHVESVLES